MTTTQKIIDEITAGINPYFGYAHFEHSNMADYTLMATTITDLAEVYGLDESEAGEVVLALTH
jgi:hypothetical protein